MEATPAPASTYRSDPEWQAAQAEYLNEDDDPDRAFARSVRAAVRMYDIQKRYTSGPTAVDGDALDLIARAREIGPALRASGSDRDRLAGWLLGALADELEARIAPAAGTPR